MREFLINQITIRRWTIFLHYYTLTERRGGKLVMIICSIVGIDYHAVWLKTINLFQSILLCLVDCCFTRNSSLNRCDGLWSASICIVYILSFLSHFHMRYYVLLHKAYKTKTITCFYINGRIKYSHKAYKTNHNVLLH